MNLQKNSSRAAADEANSDTVEVLYQKMGDRWFAFSLIDDEVFVGSITQDEINAAEPPRSGAWNGSDGPNA